jgi:hypothetical protein
VLTQRAYIRALQEGCTPQHAGRCADLAWQDRIDWPALNAPVGKASE